MYGVSEEMTLNSKLQNDKVTFVIFIYFSTYFAGCDKNVSCTTHYHSDDCKPKYQGRIYREANKAWALGPAICTGPFQGPGRVP